MLEIHPVAPVFQYQRIVDDFPPVFADNHRKGMVNRGLNHDPVPQFGEALNGAGNTRNNAGGEPDLVRFHLPAVAAAHPAPDGLEKGGGLHRVAQQFVFTAAAQGFHDERGGFEVHVCHPQGQQVIPAPARQQGFVF